jgi:hypothetical protein
MQYRFEGHCEAGHANSAALLREQPSGGSEALRAYIGECSRCGRPIQLERVDDQASSLAAGLR